MARVSIENEISLDDLAEQIVHNFGMASNLSYDDIVNFFASIDDHIGDWNLTRAIAARFNREIKRLEGIGDL